MSATRIHTFDRPPRTRCSYILIEELWDPAGSEVRELPAAHLRDERVEDAVAVGKKGDEATVRGDRRVDLGSREVRDALDVCVRPPRAHHELAHVTKDTPNPPGGTFDRDPNGDGCARRPACSAGRRHIGWNDRQSVELSSNLVGGLPSVGRLLGEALHHDVDQSRRQVLPERGQRPRVASVRCAERMFCRASRPNGGCPASSS
jgi:hypothetical protein